MCQVRKEQMTSVIWTTSMGLPIVQPYRKMARKQVDTAIQSVYISDPYKAAEGDFFIFCASRKKLTDYFQSIR